jgi:hypothetical protein
VLDIPELMLYSGAVTTPDWFAPCHDASIRQDCSKSKGCAINLLDIPELTLDSGAVTTTVCMAPRDNSVTSATPQSKRIPCCSYLWLLCNSSKAVFILQRRKIKRFCWI